MSLSSYIFYLRGQRPNTHLLIEISKSVICC
nr:MAG TPA: hypothetical protein [Caudoviricetes sp.]